MIDDLKDVIPVDDFFRSSNVATDFFKRKDRSKACDTSDVINILLFYKTFHLCLGYWYTYN